MVLETGSTSRSLTNRRHEPRKRGEPRVSWHDREGWNDAALGTRREAWNGHPVRDKRFEVASAAACEGLKRFLRDGKGNAIVASAGTAGTGQNVECLGKLRQQVQASVGASSWSGTRNLHEQTAASRWLRPEWTQTAARRNPSVMHGRRQTGFGWRGCHLSRTALVTEKSSSRHTPGRGDSNRWLKRGVRNRAQAQERSRAKPDGIEKPVMHL